MTHLLYRLCIAALVAMFSASAAHAQVGVQQQRWSIEGQSGGAEPVTGLVWYPSAALAQTQRFGPFEVNAAPGATPTPGRHPMVVISHGTGGTELGHAWLAERLAADGYVVVTLRHPGDNYEDRSGAGRPDYFVVRPHQVSRVIDRVLADARWSALIDAGRIAAIGHSAGGYTVLALAGARPDLDRLLGHCTAQGAGLRDDAAMCSLGGFSAERPAPVRSVAPSNGATLPDLRDARIRAVVAVAPLGVVFDPGSLAAVQVPVLVEYGTADSVLVPRFHAEALCTAMPRATCVRSADAGHFALFQTATGPLGPPSIDPSQDPAGFDRAAWQAQAWPRLRDFLAQALR